MGRIGPQGVVPCATRPLNPGGVVWHAKFGNIPSEIRSAARLASGLPESQVDREAVPEPEHSGLFVRGARPFAALDRKSSSVGGSVTTIR